MIELGRRGFLGGLAAVFAAPAIVRVDSLMPVKLFSPNERWVQYYVTHIDRWRMVVDFSMDQLPMPAEAAIYPDAMISPSSRALIAQHFRKNLDLARKRVFERGSQQGIHFDMPGAPSINDAVRKLVSHSA